MNQIPIKTTCNAWTVKAESLAYNTPCEIAQLGLESGLQFL
jgi:hypothetical protein